MVQAAYEMGELGSGFASSMEELKALVAVSLSHSPQVLPDPAPEPATSNPNLEPQTHENSRLNPETLSSEPLNLIS